MKITILPQGTLAIYEQIVNQLKNAVVTGELKAGDIVTDGTVEILNPDLHIATVAEGGHLVMELTSNMGRGYNTAEKNSGIMIIRLALMQVFLQIRPAYLGRGVFSAVLFSN